MNRKTMFASGVWRGADEDLTFIDMDAYYAVVPDARDSRELDFGTWWRSNGNVEVWAVRWVVTTGDVYALRLYPVWRKDSVRLLGRITDEREVRARLDGWAWVCGLADSLDWVRHRVAAPIGAA